MSGGDEGAEVTVTGEAGSDSSGGSSGGLAVAGAVTI